MQVLENGRPVISPDDAEDIIIRCLRQYGPLTTTELREYVAQTTDMRKGMSYPSVVRALHQLQEARLIRAMKSETVPLFDQTWDLRSWHALRKVVRWVNEAGHALWDYINGMVRMLFS